MAQTLDTNALMQMSLFEKITHAKVKDCFEQNNNLIIFVVQPNQLKKAIGPKGANVKRLENMLKKKLRIIQFDPDIAKFIENLCYPNKVKSVEFGSQMLWNAEKHSAIIEPADVQARGYIIGKDAANLRIMEEICKRYFKIDEIRVGGEKPSQTLSEEERLDLFKEDALPDEDTLESVFTEEKKED